MHKITSEVKYIYILFKFIYEVYIIHFYEFVRVRKSIIILLRTNKIYSVYIYKKFSYLKFKKILFTHKYMIYHRISLIYLNMIRVRVLELYFLRHKKK